MTGYLKVWAVSSGKMGKKIARRMFFEIRHRIRKAMPLLLAKRRSLFRREIISVI